MQFVDIRAKFALWWLFSLFQFSEGRTDFTMKPPRTVYGILNGNVVFHWKFAFGDTNDRLHFHEIVWGETDGKTISNKYITVLKNGNQIINPALDLTLKTRLNATSNISQLECSWTFVLKKAKREDDRITYGSAIDVDGTTFRDGPIHIILQIPPAITDHSKPTNDVEEGDDVRLFCKASGDPKPSIEWRKDGVVLQRSSKSTEIWIQKIYLKDSGSYICTALNNAGSVSYSLLVRVLRYRPYIDKNSSSNAVVKSWIGHEIILKCAVDANPAASFTWFQDGRLISRNANSTHNIGTLSIKPINITAFGRYSCKTENIKGIAWHNITVEQLYTPSPPIINTMKPALFSITTTWNISLDEGGSPVLDYRIILLDMNNQVLRNRSGNTETNCTIQNLKHNTTYIIYIQARNVVGYGKAVNRTVLTLAADPPRVLSITAVPSMWAVNISWNSTNDNTGIKIQGHRIILTDTVSGQQREFITGNVSSLYVTKLRHNRTYQVTVQARNEDGYGRFQMRNFTTLQADPPGPPVVEVIPRGPFALAVRWNSSTQDLYNIKILDYILKVFDGPFAKQIYTAITNTSLIVKNLSRNRTYVIEIQARNEVGYGEVANISATTSLVGPPDAPSIINITVYGKSCFLQWETPYNGESSIQAYTISVWILKGNKNEEKSKKWLRQWNTTKTNYKMDLKWGVNYTVAISAWNKYGQSFYGIEEHFSTESTNTKTTASLSTSSDTKQGKETMPSTSPTKPPTIKSGIGTANTRNIVNKEWEISNKNSLTHLAPLWIVVIVFTIPATLFMLWKATQKLKLCCKKPISLRGSRQLPHTESESSSITMEEVKRNKGKDSHERIKKIVEMKLNHGYNDDENEPHLMKPMSQLENNVYNHLHHTSSNSGLNEHKSLANTNQVILVKPTKRRHTELESGRVKRTPKHVYSQFPHSGSFVTRQSTTPREYSNNTPSKCQWEISRDRLNLQRIICRGQYAVFKKGFAFNLNNDGNWVPVSVKTLDCNSGEINELQRKDLLSELSLMKRLSPHKHVIQLLACITEKEPLCIITEFATFGDLLGFLRKKSGVEDNYYNIDYLPRRSLDSNQLIKFASDIADGMAYLHSAKVVHRDLAARNVLLDENLTCKVTNFGLTKDIRGQDLYKKTPGGRLPVKWTAIESLLHGLYTSKSDVWSFGVVLFEIVTIGGSPYPVMESLELIDRLESGYRMEKPHHITDELYSIMLSCWIDDPNMRPSFAQLQTTLGQLATKDKDCIDLRTYKRKLYEKIQTPEDRKQILT